MALASGLPCLRCKDIEVGSYFFLQEILLNQGSSPHLSHLLQTGSLSIVPPQKPHTYYQNSETHMNPLWILW